MDPSSVMASGERLEVFITTIYVFSVYADLNILVCLVFLSDLSGGAGSESCY